MILPNVTLVIPLTRRYTIKIYKPEVAGLLEIFNLPVDKIINATNPTRKKSIIRRRTKESS
jgi:hypothetical protein